MILLFGGTTEGRVAIKTLEEAGKPYYYSTKTGEQEVTLRHGIRINGGMDMSGIKDFCKSREIRLIIDAAHPFANELHKNVAAISENLEIPAIRFERIFPKREEDIIWCDAFTDIPTDMKLLLATTGVHSITKLQHLEAKGVNVIYRILPRESSIKLAHAQGADDDHLCFYHEGENELEVLKNLHPDAILLKESGNSGGFVEKVKAAREAGIRIIAIKRPPTPKIFHTVNGEHGLRRMVEKLLPEFYDLHSGLTTGTCAAAAAKAATIRLLRGETPSSISIVLPNGESIPVDVAYGDGFAYVIKESGDDPDVTDGIEIRAFVEISDRFQIHGGEGIGTITLPGFDYPPGSPAINRVPRHMIYENIKELVTNASSSLSVTITVPKGTEIANRTFNPRLGIVGGISIVGVSGIIKPFSEEAFINSIRKCLEVAKASGTERVVINSGGKSERFVKALYPELPSQAFVEYGNYIGDTIKMASELEIDKLTLGVMMGKAVKLSAGQLDTHSRKGVMDKKWISCMLQESDCEIDCSMITMARELWDILPSGKKEDFCHTVIKHCMEHCKPLLPNGNLTILLIDEDGKVFGL